MNTSSARLELKFHTADEPWSFSTSFTNGTYNTTTTPSETENAPLLRALVQLMVLVRQRHGICQGGTLRVSGPEGSVIDRIVRGMRPDRAVTRLFGSISRTRQIVKMNRATSAHPACFSLQTSVLRPADIIITIKGEEASNKQMIDIAARLTSEDWHHIEFLSLDTNRETTPDFCLPAEDKRLLGLVASLIFHFCERDQIEETGAWGKGVVRVDELARNERMTPPLRLEGSMSPTSEMLPILVGLKDDPTWGTRAANMCSKAVTYLLSRWNPLFGFGRMNLAFGREECPEVSMRHTAAVSSALLEVHDVKAVQCATEGACLVANWFPHWLSGALPDQCPSATVAYILQLIDSLHHSDFLHVLRARPDLNSFVEDTDRIQQECISKLQWAMKAYDRLPWLPAYGNFEVYTYRATFQLLRHVPSALLSDIAEVAAPALCALLEDIDDFGLPLAPRRKDAYRSDDQFERLRQWREPDFGTTCGMLALLLRPAIRALLEQMKMDAEAEAAQRNLLRAIRTMIESPEHKYFAGLWNGPASMLIETAKRFDAERVIFGSTNNHDSKAHKKLPESIEQVLTYVASAATMPR